mmetsp:Transcript_12554/g.15116  ORF Transcript_12554/g.15116 Transcript_12554/m.15116 type:complete len:274 (-) Transcript_12554:11874-12695(-)
MQTKRESTLRRERLVDVLKHLPLVQRIRRVKELREELQTFQKIVLHVAIEVAERQSTIPIFNNVPTVHNLTEDILQIVPGNLVIVLEVVHSALAATQQVTRVERIVHVPPDTRSGPWDITHPKLLPLEERRVEVRQREANRLELRLLRARVDNLIREVRAGSLQVGVHPLRRFVRQLDGVLQQRDREPLLENRGRFRRQEQPELLIRSLRQLIHPLVQRTTRPVNRQVDILQQSPASVLVEVHQIVHRNGLLTLSQRHRRVPPVVRTESHLRS